MCSVDCLFLHAVHFSIIFKSARGGRVEGGWRRSARLCKAESGAEFGRKAVLVAPRLLSAQHRIDSPYFSPLVDDTILK